MLVRCVVDCSSTLYRLFHRGVESLFFLLTLLSLSLSVLFLWLVYSFTLRCAKCDAWSRKCSSIFIRQNNLWSTEALAATECRIKHPSNEHENKPWIDLSAHSSSAHTQYSVHEVSVYWQVHFRCIDRIHI